MALHFWKIKERGPDSDILHFLGAIESIDIPARRDAIKEVANGEEDVSLYCFRAPAGPNERFSNPLRPVHLLRVHFSDLPTAVNAFLILCEALTELPANVVRVRVWRSSKGPVKLEIGFLDGGSEKVLRDDLERLLPRVVWFRNGNHVIPVNLLIPSPANRGVVPYGGDPVF